MGSSVRARVGPADPIPVGGPGPGWRRDAATMGRWTPSTRRTRRRCGCRAAGCVVVGGGNVAQRRVPGAARRGRRRGAGVAGGHAGDRGPGRRRRDRLARSAASSAPTSTGRGTSSPPPTGPWSTPQVSRGGRGSSASSACAPTTPARPPRGPRPSAGTPGSPSPWSATASRDAPRRSATRSSRACATARSPVREHEHDAGRRAGRRRARATPTSSPSRPRRALADADVVVADRLAPRELLGELAPDVELVDVAKLPRGRSATQEEINRAHRRPGAGGQAGGAASRAATASSSAAASRRRWPAPRPGSRARVVPGHHQRRSRCPPSPASRSPTAASRTSSPSSPGTCRRTTPTRWSTWDGGRAGCAARSCCSWRCRTCRAIADAPRRRRARRRRRPVAVVADGSMPTQRTAAGRRSARSGPTSPREQSGPRRSSWSAGSSPWPTRRGTHGSLMADARRGHRPGRPAARGLPRPARRRAAQAPRGRAGPVHRRGREGRPPRGRGRLRAPARS